MRRSISSSFVHASDASAASAAETAGGRGVRAASKASGGTKKAKPMTAEELRAKLRPLFDKFDVLFFV